MKPSKKKLIELLKSGNFTLAYHDNDDCCLYEGHQKYDDLEADSEIFSFGPSDSYAPSEVILLVEALGGKCRSL